MKVTRELLERGLEFLNKRLGSDLNLDRQSTGWRVNLGERCLSPRIKGLKPILSWIEAFEEGVELGRKSPHE